MRHDRQLIMNIPDVTPSFLSQPRIQPVFDHSKVQRALLEQDDI